jgi:hypothetical protein
MAQEEIRELRDKLAKLSEDYRERLHKYISDVAHLSTGLVYYTTLN